MNLDPLSLAVLTRAINFLFDEAGQFLRAWRDSRNPAKDKADSELAYDGSASAAMKADVLQWIPEELLLKDHADEVQHSLDQIYQYRKNRRLLESQIALQGGLKYAPPKLQDQLRETEQQLEAEIYRLKFLVELIYNKRVEIR